MPAAIYAEAILCPPPPNFSAIGAWLKGLLGVLMPFIIGILIAYILYIPSRKVESFYRKFKRPRFISKKARPLAVFTVYLIALILKNI